ncbi:MAG TPA: TonB family protein [Povalibacter sp.]|uniref:TonB family protein n=1 Tax=Povalibacter sp. TaxID=1962978 RepID=UPI002C6F2FCF|nr:TonB family protein [Povalibacter sp.]HMN46118.1 TonB family protein [Povalibacter sp.]
MNTAEFDTRLRRQHPPERPGPRLQAVATAPIAITVLTTDPALCEAIRAAAGTQHPVAIAASLDEATHLAAAGNCGILITDQALTQQALVQIGRQMRTYDPATITIAVGSRGDDNALIGLLSSAVVERFMLKPVTPSLARLVIRSAASEYQSLKYRARREPAAPPPEVPVEHSGEPVVVPMPALSKAESPIAVPASAVESAQEPTRVAAMSVMVEPRARPATPASTPSRFIPGWPVWSIAAVAALIVGAAVWWTMQSRRPDIDSRQVIATNLAAAKQALDNGRYVEPAESSALHFYGVVLSLDAMNAQARQGMDAIADRMIEDVKLAIIDGRLAEAGIALERLRRISPDHRRLAVLDGELREEQASQLARLQSPPPVPEARSTAAPVVVAGRTSARKKAPDASPVLADEAMPAIAPVAASNRAGAANPLDMGPPAPPAREADGAGAALSAPIVAVPAPPPAAKIIEEKIIEPAEPKLVKAVQPDFPRDALEHGIEGWVDLTLAVAASGKVASVRVNEAQNGRFFERAAMNAVKRWEYAPSPSADPAVTQPVRVRVSFRLQK